MPPANTSKAPSMNIPLLRTRIVVLFLMMLASLIAGSRCVKMFQKHATAQEWLNATAPPGIKITVEYDDIQTAVIATFVSASLLSALSSNILLCILQDKYRFLPASLVKLMPRSSTPRALRAHTILFLLASAVSAAPTAFLVWVVFTLRVGEADIRATTSTGELVRCTTREGVPCVRIFYSLTPWININAILPWPEVFFSLVSAAVSGCAWKMATCENNRVESVEDGLSAREINDHMEVAGEAADQSADISGTVIGNEDVAAEDGKEKGGDIEKQMLPSLEF
ncbi:hypothetical protein FIBSPDRAFT_333559 [Athelia psychrophila]|uniref:Uncharacterized protein n=1 Tax=Athelia psychrophila TaxID=1759441 RepID=A0A166Q4H8_9AGAM|nr:hypothetical protein FIBSPDRAFT_333559 [Fibularhizoctonia sp. CBS 109695]